MPTQPRGAITITPGATWRITRRGGGIAILVGDERQVHSIHLREGSGKGPLTIRFSGEGRPHAACVHALVRAWWQQREILADPRVSRLHYIVEEAADGTYWVRLAVRGRGVRDPFLREIPKAFPDPTAPPGRPRRVGGMRLRGGPDQARIWEMTGIALAGIARHALDGRRDVAEGAVQKLQAAALATLYSAARAADSAT